MSTRSRTAIVYLLGFGIDLANMFMINAAYPALQRELHASVSQLAWIGNIYVLGLTVVIPLGVWLARRYGERRVLVGSLLLFAAGCLGGGLLIPIGQAMAYRAYPPAARAWLTSIVMMVALLVPALSPAVGGLVADHASWRAMFFGMLPLAVAAAALALAWVPRDEDGEQPPALDILGLALSVVSLVALLLGLTYASEAGAGRRSCVALALAVIAACVYVRHARRTRMPLLDLKLLAQLLLRTGLVIYLCVPGVFTGVNLVASLYLQNRLGLSATHVGALMLPWSMASFAAIATMHRGFPRWGARPMFGWGIVVEALGIIVLATPLAGMEAGRVMAFAAMGFGASLCTSTAQSAAFLDVPPERMGEASALWNINRQLSFCLGVAVLGSMLNRLLSLAAYSAAALPYQQCFGLAALLTLLPLPLVWRLRTHGTSATVSSSH